MKKLVKAMSILAALAMLGSAFISCSDGGSSGGSGGEPENPETPETPETPGGGGEPENTTELVATVWSVDDYISDLGTTDGTVTEGKVLGFVTAVKEVAYAYKDPSAGTGANTWTGVTDVGYYSSFSVNADGNTEKKVLKIAVPSDAKAISVFGKCGSSTNTSNLTLASGADSIVKSVDLPDATWKTILDKEDISSYAGSDLFIYNGKAGTGKLTIKAIIIWKEAKVNPAPAATNFTPSSTAEGYSITVTDSTGIEYSTDNGTTWVDATATITLDTYGKVLFRTKATDDAGASSTVEVTVEEYIDTSKPQADKPAADNFAVVKSANGNDGSITLTSATGIEYKNGDVWEDAQASYKGLAAGTYSFRTKETEEKRASEALEVAVEAFVLPETVAAETNWDLTKEIPFSGIPSRSGSGNAATVMTVSEGSFNGYLGKKLWLVNGVAAEYASSTLGYCESAGDSTKSLDEVKGLQTEAITGPFTFSVKTAATKDGRTIRFYISSSKDNLFDAANFVVAKAFAADTFLSVTYAGTEAVYVGVATGTDSAKAGYTQLKGAKLVSTTAIPADVFPATAVAFSNDGIESEAITISKAQAEAQYQLTTTITPAYSTDSVTFTKVSGDDDISVSEDGKVSVAADYSKNAAVVVKATAGSAEATLTVNVNAAIALTADTVVTISADKTTAKPSTDVTFTASLSKDVTEEITYEWYVGEEKQSETSKTFKFNTTTVGVYSVTCKAKKDSVSTAASEAVSVKISNDFTFDATKELAALGKGDSMSTLVYGDVTFSASSKRANSNAFAVEVVKASGTATVVVKNGAKVKFTISSSGSTNLTSYKINGVCTEKSGIADGTSETVVEVTANADGNIVLNNTQSDKGLRIYKIEVTY